LFLPSNLFFSCSWFPSYREHIERENKKWQQLFQAANLRKRQALAELELSRAVLPMNSSNGTSGEAIAL